MASKKEVCCSVSLGTPERQEGIPSASLDTTGNENDIGSYFLNHLFPDLNSLKYRQPTDVPTTKNLKHRGDTMLKEICQSKKSVHLNIAQSSKILPCTKDLFEILSNHGIKTETVIYEANKDQRETDDKTVYCKNLFLKDRRGQFYLIICHEDDKVNLKTLKTKLNAHRNFSFASAVEVENILGVAAGGVSPLALMRETAKNVKVAAFQTITEMKTLNFHPLDPAYATRMSFSELCLFLSLFGHTVEILN